MNDIANIYTKILCSEVMNKNFVTINEDDEFSLAEEKFVVHGIYYLIVLRGRELAGLISHKYLYKTQSPRKILGDGIDYNPNIVIDGDAFYDKETLDSYILEHIMLKDPFTLGPDNTLADVVQAMSKRKIGCIPIIDKKRKVLGIITEKDLIKYIAVSIGS